MSPLTSQKKAKAPFSQLASALVGKTKRGKGTKILAIAVRSGLPVALCIASASPHEVTLVEELLLDRATGRKPERLISDKAYDSKALDQRLASKGIQLIAPSRRGREKRLSTATRCAATIAAGSSSCCGYGFTPCVGS